MKRESSRHSIARAINEFGLKQVPFEIEAVVDFLQTQNIQNFVEIGTDSGGSFYLWCSLFAGLKISIDLPHAEFGSKNFDYAAMNQSIRSQFPDVHFIHGHSNEQETVHALEEILNHTQVDFLFIDGDHTFDGVLADFLLYRKYVKDGGWIGFHDTKDTEFHRSKNCRVDKLWNALKGDKISFTADYAGWAGIGLLKNNAQVRVAL